MYLYKVDIYIICIHLQVVVIVRVVKISYNCELDRKSVV